MNIREKRYKKSDSIISFSADRKKSDEIISRISNYLNSSKFFEDDQYKRGIVIRSVDDILSQKNEQPYKNPALFRLRPHVVEEIDRINDIDIPRYLFYRYRYDVFPVTRTVDSYPPCLQVEPTSICNFRCVFCYQTDKRLTQGRNGHMGMMDLGRFRAIIEQASGEIEAITLASRGEPTLAKSFGEMMATTSGRFLALKINTNASKINEKLIHDILAAEPNTVVFSADAADEKLYSQLRVNGELPTVLRNIKLFNEIRSRIYPKSKTISRVSGVRYSPNQQNFDEIDSFWKEHVDQVAFVDYNPWENSYDRPANSEVTPCSDLWRRMFIWWDGRSNPCDVDYLSKLSVGSIGAEQSLSALWGGDAYAALRNAHVAGDRQSLEPCRSCVVV